MCCPASRILPAVAVVVVMTTLHAPQSPGVLVVVVRPRRGVVVRPRGRIVIRPRGRVVIHPRVLASLVPVTPPLLRRSARAQSPHDGKKHDECTDHALHCTYSEPHYFVPSLLSSFNGRVCSYLWLGAFAPADLFCKRGASVTGRQK